MNLPLHSRQDQSGLEEEQSKVVEEEQSNTLKEEEDLNSYQSLSGSLKLTDIHAFTESGLKVQTG